MIGAMSPAMLAAMAVAGTPDEARDQVRGVRGLHDRLLCFVPSHALAGGEITEQVDAVIDDVFGG